MPHATELIGTVAVGLSAAFVFALLAVRLRLPLIDSSLSSFDERRAAV